ncbi:hypothetical protein Peur_034768 [Populus x canadensis]
MNPCPDFASSAKHWDTPLQHATQLSVISSPREEPHGAPSIDPMAAEAAVAVDKGPGCSVHKRAKLDSHPGSPEVSSGSPQAVHVSEACYEVAAPSPPRRQYLTRSKAASAIGRSGVPSGRRGRPSKHSSSADSRIQGSTPSSSL